MRMFRPGGESSRNLWQRHLVCMSARPFTEPEYLTLSQHFASAHRTRDRLLLILGCATGYRIQELLSLTVGQVWDGADVVREITVARKDLKGGRGKIRTGCQRPQGAPFRGSAGCRAGPPDGDRPWRDRPVSVRHRPEPRRRHEPLPSLPGTGGRLHRFRDRYDPRFDAQLEEDLRRPLLRRIRLRPHQNPARRPPILADHDRPLSGNGHRRPGPPGPYPCRLSPSLHTRHAPLRVYWCLESTRLRYVAGTRDSARLETAGSWGSRATWMPSCRPHRKSRG